MEMQIKQAISYQKWVTLFTSMYYTTLIKVGGESSTSFLWVLTIPYVFPVHCFSIITVFSVFKVTLQILSDVLSLKRW